MLRRGVRPTSRGSMRAEAAQLAAETMSDVAAGWGDLRHSYIKGRPSRQPKGRRHQPLPEARNRLLGPVIALPVSRGIPKENRRPVLIVTQILLLAVARLRLLSETSLLLGRFRLR